MKTKLLLLLLPLFSFAQEETTPERFFLQFDVSLPFAGQPHYNENGESDGIRPTIDGLNSKFGGGIHYNKWLGLSLHSGIDWSVTRKLVAVPIFANLRIAPDLGDDNRIILQAGYGHGFALGRGDLSGDYKKVSLGFGDSEILIFIEYARYGFQLYKNPSVESLSIGISKTTF